ncbi:MAG: RNA polymerase sigma-70 factor [Prevotella sp.]|nr:RNA polymerase sigma-70 factor [Prevotella sp.]MDO5525544.1 RNA polymerase sigma-70 factor [Prevotella sp.]
MQNKETFDRIFRQYYRQLYVFANRIVADDEESCDLVHDCFEELWIHINDTDEQSARQFLYTCLRRKCIDHLRHKEAGQRYIMLTATVTSKWDTEADIEQMEQREQQIKECIEALKPPTREIFTLCYVEHKKYAEAAELLGVSVSTIKKHIVRALKYFRERRKNSET